MNVTKTKKVEKHAGLGRGRVLLQEDQVAPPGLGTGEQTPWLRGHPLAKGPGSQAMSQGHVQGWQY